MCKLYKKKQKENKLKHMNTKYVMNNQAKKFSLGLIIVRMSLLLWENEI